MRTILAFFIAALTFTSCTIRQEITFNSDFSGKSVLTIDMSALTAFDDSGTMMTELQDSLSADQFSKFTSVEGISNFQMVFDTNTSIITMSYDFASVEALNRVLSTQESDLSPDTLNPGPKTTHQYFSQKGKKLIYRERPATVESAPDLDSAMTEMDEMFKFENKIILPSDVKKLKGPDEVSYTGKDITWARKISEFGKDKKPFTFTVSMR